VSLKAAGLMALSGQAGLFLPCDAAELAAAGGPPVVAAFEGGVLADIGDSQSLQQSLSTFSGHIRRIKRVRACPLVTALARSRAGRPGP
jgi:DNA mismatch repair protein MutS2